MQLGTARQSRSDAGEILVARRLCADDEAAIRQRIRANRAIDAMTEAQRRQWLDDVDAAHALRTRRADHLEPTAETERKLRRCVIARLAATPLRTDDGRLVTGDRGAVRYRLEPDQVLAAIDIEEHFLAIGRGLWARASAYDVVSTAGRQLRDPIGRMTDRDQERMAERYMPWATIEQGRRVGNASALEIVTDIVIDNIGPAQAERRHRIRNGRAYRVLYGSLARYCRIAGWREPAPLPERAEAGSIAEAMQDAA